MPPGIQERAVRVRRVVSGRHAMHVVELPPVTRHEVRLILLLGRRDRLPEGRAHPSRQEPLHERVVGAVRRVSLEHLLAHRVHPCFELRRRRLRNPVVDRNAEHGLQRLHAPGRALPSRLVLEHRGLQVLPQIDDVLRPEPVSQFDLRVCGSGLVGIRRPEAGSRIADLLGDLHAEPVEVLLVLRRSLPLSLGLGDLPGVAVHRWLEQIADHRHRPGRREGQQEEHGEGNKRRSNHGRLLSREGVSDPVRANRERIVDRNGTLVQPDRAAPDDALPPGGRWPPGPSGGPTSSSGSG